MNRLHRQALAYLALLHVLLLAMAWPLLQERPVSFVLAEVGLLLSFVLGVKIARRALEPLGYTQRLHELLQDGEYAVRLRPAGDDALTRLVEQFNALLDKLHSERLKLGEQRGFLERLLAATPSAVIVFDFDGRVSLHNPSAAALLTLRDPLGQTLAALADGATGARERRLLQQLAQLPADASGMLDDPDGRRYRVQQGHFHDRGFARQFLLIDELTMELQSSERATYEKLVRVLGHEVNNTVAATGSVLDSLLFYRGQLTEDDGQDFATAIEAVKRRNASLGRFIERFAQVAKLPAPELQACAVQDVVEGIAALYREPCRALGVSIGWRRCDAVPPLPLDRHLLEQALQNIVKNAMEAADASRRERGGAAWVQLELAAEGNGARLSVVDSGAGLAGVPAGQLFTPFFSTKKGGQGIGLLLVREVLLRHGFAHRLAANEAGETSFDIWLTRP